MHKSKNCKQLKCPSVVVYLHNILCVLIQVIILMNNSHKHFFTEKSKQAQENMLCMIPFIFCSKTQSQSMVRDVRVLVTSGREGREY